MFQRSASWNELLPNLCKALDYNPLTGIFRWKIRPSNRVQIGDIAGCKRLATGYIIIVYHKHEFQGHVLAWYIMTNEIIMVDHKNRIRHDNRFENLRPCNHSLNGANRKPTNELGLKGVYRKSDNVFTAQICINYKRIHLGTFSTPEEARAAYLKAAKEAFGEFADE